MGFERRKIYKIDFIGRQMDRTLCERVLGLLQSEEYLSLRYQGVTERLKTDPDETLIAMRSLLDDGVLFKRAGYYQLNPHHLWKISLG